VDAANDLALLKAEGKFAALPVAASSDDEVGQHGCHGRFPRHRPAKGSRPSLRGEKLVRRRGRKDDARYFQISVPVQARQLRRRSGGWRGNVVGVLSACSA